MAHHDALGVRGDHSRVQRPRQLRQAYPQRLWLPPGAAARQRRRHHQRQQQANAPFPNIHSPTSYFSSGTTVPSSSSLAETIWLRVLRAISSSRIRLGKSDSSV